MLGDYGMAPWGKLRFANLVLPPPSYLRTTFHVGKPIKRATLYATALGIFDVHLNGQRVTDDYFNPGWTDYTKRVYDRAFDVTDQVRAGDNALGAILADGWYSGYVGFGKLRDHYGKKPRFRALLHLEFADGSTADVVTSPAWRASTGPIHEADFLMGEAYDARRPSLRGWDAAGFDDSRWSAGRRRCRAEPSRPVAPRAAGAAVRRAQAASITEPKPGRLCLRPGPELRRRRPAQDRAASQAGNHPCASPSGSIPTARSTRPTSARPASPILIFAMASVRKPGRPGSPSTASSTSRSPGLKSPPTAETITGLALSQRHAGRRLVHVFRPDAQPASQQYLLDATGQLHRHPDRLPPARRAAGLDGRRPGLYRHGRA